MIETRTTEQRLADLEHDNNVLRAMLTDVQVDNSRLRQEFEGVSSRCDKLIAKVNEFVGRFAVVN